jgi:hypothetical protein
MFVLDILGVPRHDAIAAGGHKPLICRRNLWNIQSL